jgi:formate dehydrogenase subunit gamma
VSAEEAVAAAIAQHADSAGALLPMLHAIQDRLGFIPSEAVPRLADALNLSRAEVYGVITFYHDFRSAPPGRHVLKVCRAEACQAMGATALVDHITARLGTKLGETSADGAVTVEAVYCLGNCALSPAVMLDGALLGRVDAKRADELLERCGAGR